jgi:hypothetical protein
MNPAYFETRFEQQDSCNEWPGNFAIITAFATTGQRWTADRNAAEDRALEQELRRRAKWVWRVTGYSPSTGHAEPGWAVSLTFPEACEVGKRCLQDAIYYVRQDRLGVSFCDERQGWMEVGDFLARVDLPSMQPVAIPPSPPASFPLNTPHDTQGTPSRQAPIPHPPGVYPRVVK